MRWLRRRRDDRPKRTERLAPGGRLWAERRIATDTGLDQPESRPDAQTGRSEPEPPPAPESLTERARAAESLWVHLRAEHGVSDRWLAMTNRTGAEARHDQEHALGVHPVSRPQHTHEPLTMPVVDWGLLPPHELDQVDAAYSVAIEASGGRLTRTAAVLNVMLSAQPMLRQLSPPARDERRESVVAALIKLGATGEEIVAAGDLLTTVDAEVQRAARRLSD